MLDLPELNGYIYVEANGGLNQQRASICNAVAVAGFLNATLVIPNFHYHSIWRDPRSLSLSLPLSLWRSWISFETTRSLFALTLLMPFFMKYVYELMRNDFVQRCHIKKIPNGSSEVWKCSFFCMLQHCTMLTAILTRFYVCVWMREASLRIYYNIKKSSY